MDWLRSYEDTCGTAWDSLEVARKLDEADKLRNLKELFYIPKMKDLPHVDKSLVADENEDCVYFCGQSLGLPPKKCKQVVANEIDFWAKNGVYGHFEGQLPWAHCDETVLDDMAKYVGAKRSEVAVMNGLSVNLHLLFLSLYNPQGSRRWIVADGSTFPSDLYALQSQIRMRQLDPDECLKLFKPRRGEACLNVQEILDFIRENGSSIAVIWLEAVNYLTGQLLPMQLIAEEGHKHGCLVGFDLAHAVGNVELKLHEWNIDFAVWCTYKYMNSGAGGIGGAFLHERVEAKSKLHGWWSNRAESRFKMERSVDLSEGISSFRISNPPFLLVASLRASLDVFNLTSMAQLREKSLRLTAYLEALLGKLLDRTSSFSDEAAVENEYNHFFADSLYRKRIGRIITPSNAHERGAMLCIVMNERACAKSIRQIFEALEKRGIVLDFREPCVIRVTPAPLYCSFEDVFRFYSVFKSVLTQNAIIAD